MAPKTSRASTDSSKKSEKSDKLSKSARSGDSKTKSRTGSQAGSQAGSRAASRSESMMSGDASKTGSVMKSSQQGEAESSGKASTLQDSGENVITGQGKAGGGRKGGSQEGSRASTRSGAKSLSGGGSQAEAEDEGSKASAAGGSRAASGASGAQDSLASATLEGEDAGSRMGSKPTGGSQMEGSQAGSQAQRPSAGAGSQARPSGSQRVSGGSAMDEGEDDAARPSGTMGGSQARPSGSAGGSQARPSGSAGGSQARPSGSMGASQTRASGMTGAEDEDEAAAGGSQARPSQATGSQARQSTAGGSRATRPSQRSRQSTGGGGSQSQGGSQGAAADQDAFDQAQRDMSDGGGGGGGGGGDDDGGFDDDDGYDDAGGNYNDDEYEGEGDSSSGFGGGNIKKGSSGGGGGGGNKKKKGEIGIATGYQMEDPEPFDAWVQFKNLNCAPRYKRDNDQMFACFPITDKGDLEMSQNFIACNNEEFQQAACYAGGMGYPDIHAKKGTPPWNGLTGCGPNGTGKYAGDLHVTGTYACGPNNTKTYTCGPNGTLTYNCAPNAPVTPSIAGCPPTYPGGPTPVGTPCFTVAPVSGGVAGVPGALGQGGICCPDDPNVRKPGMHPERFIDCDMICDSQFPEGFGPQCAPKKGEKFGVPADTVVSGIENCGLPNANGGIYCKEENRVRCCPTQFNPGAVGGAQGTFYSSNRTAAEAITAQGAFNQACGGLVSNGRGGCRKPTMAIKRAQNCNIIPLKNHAMYIQLWGENDIETLKKDFYQLANQYEIFSHQQQALVVALEEARQIEMMPDHKSGTSEIRTMEQIEQYIQDKSSMNAVHLRAAREFFCLYEKFEDYYYKMVDYFERTFTPAIRKNLDCCEAITLLNRIKEMLPKTYDFYELRVDYPHQQVYRLGVEEARKRFGGAVSYLPIILEIMRCARRCLAILTKKLEQGVDEDIPIVKTIPKENRPVVKDFIEKNKKFVDTADLTEKLRILNGAYCSRCALPRRGKGRDCFPFEPERPWKGAGRHSWNYAATRYCACSDFNQSDNTSSFCGRACYY